MESNEINVIVHFLSSDFLWLYFVIIVLLFFGITALLTWSLKKPFMFLGIPTIVAGIIVILFMIVFKFLPFEEKIFEYIRLMFRPLLTIGIVFFTLGISMVVIYKIINENTKNEEKMENFNK